MALQLNSHINPNHNNNHNNQNISNNTTINNINKNVSLPLTIIPLTEDVLQRQQASVTTVIKQNTPDLTFHCMCCEEYFVNPFHMYEHLNTKHADLPVPQEESEEELEDDGKDYSWVFEPVCELVAEDSGQGGGGGGREQQKLPTLEENGEEEEDDDSSSSSSSDSDSDDDDSSSTTSSSSSSSSSDSSSNSNPTQDETTRDAPELQQFNVEEEQTTMEGIEEGAYEEVEAESQYSSNSQSALNGVNLQLSDLKESTSVLLLNPAANTTITPVLPAVKRGRGRRSAAQQAAIEMSSLISGEPKCFQCSHCEASFPSAGDLSKHVRCHISNKPFQCSICEKTFTHIGSLNTHIRIHSGEKPYKCDLCSKAFTQSSSLMVHVRSHSIKKPHQCHLCDKGFVNSTSLAIHLKTHSTGEAPLSCSECDKTFKHESQLKEHMRMHSLSLVYQCSICRQAFATSSELVQHMKCHMGEKPFTCSICDRSFTQSGSLNIHMRIHTGEKPFVCKFCNKSFTQASSLSVHLKIHSGEKPFPCHICGKSYSQAAYLNKHIQNHFDAQKQGGGGVEIKSEPKETLLCIVCGELHKDSNSLALHVTQKHAALLNNMRETEVGEISEEERRRQEDMYMQQIQALMLLQQQQQHLMMRPAAPQEVLKPAKEPMAMGNVNGEEAEREMLGEETYEIGGEEEDHLGNQGELRREHEQRNGESLETNSMGRQTPIQGQENHEEMSSNYNSDDDNHAGEEPQPANPFIYEHFNEELNFNGNNMEQEMQQGEEEEDDYDEDGDDASNYSDSSRSELENNEPAASQEYNGEEQQQQYYYRDEQRSQDYFQTNTNSLRMQNLSETDGDEEGEEAYSDNEANNGNQNQFTFNNNNHNGMSSPISNGHNEEVGGEEEIGDLGQDIEMSEYPFIDDTKFDFYDDYAAEEEVETEE
ncbi:uncharacterized protein [Musca autumnalis]|uniref:uncharacterized protein n=1 Tax=Musca autumnalis TaxID=221902 RepID=UPI003CEB2DDC